MSHNKTPNPYSSKRMQCTDTSDPRVWTQDTSASSKWVQIVRTVQHWSRFGTSTALSAVKPLFNV